MGLRAIFAAIWIAPAIALAAPGIATVTIVDGSALAIRDASRLGLAEGVRLASGDLLDTAGSRLVRVEFDDGTLLDLGPESKAMLSAKLAGKRPTAKLHLLQGTAKLTVPKGGEPGLGAFTSPPFDVTGIDRSAVFALVGNGADAFAESGAVTLQDRADGKPRALVTLKAGEFFSRLGDDKPVVAARPSPVFIGRLPKAFLDALPPRAARYKDHEVEPKPLGRIAYADAAPWLDADGLRAAFVVRWKALARDPEFRRGLVTNLHAHPEWDRTLYPEKYLPKPATQNGAKP